MCENLNKIAIEKFKDKAFFCLTRPYAILSKVYCIFTA